jgi:hypothetical protein
MTLLESEIKVAVDNFLFTLDGGMSTSHAEIHEIQKANLLFEPPSCGVRLELANWSCISDGLELNPPMLTCEGFRRCDANYTRLTGLAKQPTISD